MNGLPHQSVKGRRDAKKRRDLVKTLIAIYPVCRRCKAAPATECHEPASRARYPGSHLDPLLSVPSCRACNEWAEREEELAKAEKWKLPSGLTREQARVITQETWMSGPRHEAPF